MGKQVLHIVFVLFMVVAVSFSSIAKPVWHKAPVKHEKTSTDKKAKEPTGAFVQPQVTHGHVSHVHVLLPCIVHPQYAIIFPQQEITSTAAITLLDKGSSKFFKTLFRHVIATQAP